MPEPTRVRIIRGEHEGRVGVLIAGPSMYQVDVVLPDGVVAVPAPWIEETDDGWDDGALYDTTDLRDQPRTWQVGDRVRRVDGPPILLGSVGTVVAVGIPGMWPIRVKVDKRIGFGEVLCAANELAPVDEATS
jgi:hypothetical protein